MIVINVEREIGVMEFSKLAHAAWNVTLSPAHCARALSRTINIGARVDGELIGTVRILTDGYLFGTIPEVMVHPNHRGQGVARRLMEKAWEVSPTSLFFGAQPGLEDFYESLGYEPAVQSYQRRKPRPE